MQELSIIVILATRNGGGVLRRTLDGYRRAVADGVRWELIVVDNGSDDDTPAILDEFRQTLPLTTLHESRPGKNVALNLAIEQALHRHDTPDLFVFTDDDAIPEAGFLAGWAQAATAQPDYDIFGGLVLPEFATEPPEWLRDCVPYFPELYAQNIRPEGAVAARHIYGPNMAVRGSVAASGCRFDETIGPNGDAHYAMGSETEFCVRIERQLGLRAWFSQATQVRHQVRTWQMTPEFFVSRAFRHGRGTARQQHRAHQRSGRRALMLRVLCRMGECHLRMIMASPPRRHSAVWQYNWWRGYLRELRDAPRAPGGGAGPPRSDGRPGQPDLEPLPRRMNMRRSGAGRSG